MGDKYEILGGFQPALADRYHLRGDVGEFCFLILLAETHTDRNGVCGVWVGIGAVGVAVLGMLWFKEPVTVARIACISLIVAGVIGLKFWSPATDVV